MPRDRIDISKHFAFISALGLLNLGQLNLMLFQGLTFVCIIRLSEEGNYLQLYSVLKLFKNNDLEIGNIICH